MMFKNLSPSALGVSGHQSEIIELALTYGFSSMDLSITEFAAAMRIKGVEYARRLIDSAKLRIAEFPLPFDWDTDDAQFQKNLGRLPEYTQAAAELACTRAVATIAPAGDKRPYHENFEFHRRRLSELGTALAGAGVRLAVGFQAAEYLRKNQAFQFIHDLDALVQLVGMVNSPAVGLLIDTWDVAVCGGTPESLKKLPPQQIVAVQVAEAPAEGAPAEFNEGSRLLPGDEKGRGQVAPMLTALAELGFDGPVTPKPSRSAFPNRKRDLVVKLAAESLDRVWKAANLPVEPRRIVASARD